MNEILVIHDDTSPQYPINGRELHEQLGVETPYHNPSYCPRRWCTPAHPASASTLRVR